MRTEWTPDQIAPTADELGTVNRPKPVVVVREPDYKMFHEKLFGDAPRRS